MHSADISPQTETVVDMINKLLPTPVPPSLADIGTTASAGSPDTFKPGPQQLMDPICPPTPVAQERSPAGDLETLLLNWLPVGTVTEEDVVSPKPSTGFGGGVRGIDPHDGPMPDS